MDKSGFWKELCPIWWDEIKSWFGWGSWRQTLTSTFVSVGSIILLFLGGKIEIANEEVSVRIAAICFGLFWLFVVILISFVTASRMLYGKKPKIIKSLQAKNKRLNNKIKQNIKRKIDVSIIPYISDKKDIVGLEIVNNSDVEPILCKATIQKMDYFKVDPKEDSRWIPVDIKKYGSLSWLYKGADDNGFKEVFGNSNIIEIAKYQMSFFKFALRNLSCYTFCFHGGTKEFIVAKYRLVVNFVIKADSQNKVVTWKGCIDMPEAVSEDLSWSDLSIWECEDVKNWK